MRRRALSLLSGFLLGGGAAGISFVTASLALRMLGSETEAFVQQSLGDTASLTAGHVRSVLDGWLREMADHGDAQMKAFLARKEAEAIPLGTVQAAPDSAVAAAEMNPDILDVALWTRQGQDGQAVKVHFAMNSRFSKPDADLMERVRSREAEEKEALAAAFQGLPVAFLQLGIDEEAMLTLAKPLGNGPVNEIVVAHVRIRALGRTVLRERLIQGMLIDGAGRVIVQSDHDASATSLSDKAVFASLREQAVPSGQMTYKDEDGTPRMAAFERVGVGQLAVIVQLSSREAMGGVELLRMKALVLAGALFVLLTIVGYFLFRGEDPAARPTAKAKGKPSVAAQPLPADGPTAVEPQGSPGADAQPATEEAATRAAPASGPPGVAPLATPATVEPEAGAPAATSDAPAAPVHAGPHPQRLPITVLWSSLREVSKLVEGETPDDAADTVNDAITLAESCVRAGGGIFERAGGSSFVALWGAPASPEGSAMDTARALRCGLELRRDFAALNESRKVNGLKPVLFGMGLHCSEGIAARIGPSGKMQDSAFGLVFDGAAKLDRLSAQAGVDLLVSSEVWQTAESMYTGERLGEARLTHWSGLTSYFGVWGYRDENGEEVRVETPYSRMEGQADKTTFSQLQPAATRWLVNNGSQIVGPFVAEEIAARIFAQEMDFDSECWAEGTGNSSEIRAAGIFGGSEDAGASYWVFDGKTIHGPLSRGFLVTAVQRGAIPPEAYVCEGSTIEGWTALEEWLKRTSATASTSGPEAAPGSEAA